MNEVIFGYIFKGEEKLNRNLIMDKNRNNQYFIYF